MDHVGLWISILLGCAALIQYTGAQKCITAEKGLDITEQAYRTLVFLKAKVTKPGKVNHTAVVTEVYDTRNGGLAKSSIIVFGPVKKGNGCTRIKKNSEYLLFLELADSSNPSFHRIMFDPVSKLSQAKKVKKLLCKGCVKAPKISGKSKSVNIKQNERFTFKCKASGNPKPIASFLKDGEILPKKPQGMKVKIKKKGGGGRLIIKKVKKDHEGVYTCNVTSFIGTANISVSLTVLKDDCVECPTDLANYCVHGRCCFVKVVNQTACRCDQKYQGRRCDEKKVPLLPRNELNVIEARYHRQTIAIMAVCIALLLVALICYIVYCKFKKSRSQMRKEIINRNGHVSATRPNEGVHNRSLTDASNIGTLVDNAGNRDQATEYQSTNLTRSVNHPAHPTAFAQRPQTYDDVILTQQAAKAQPPMHYANSSRKQEERQSRHEANARRHRRNDAAVGYSDDHSRSASDIEGRKAPRRIDEMKSGHDGSLTSSGSSHASHELRNPNIPLDDRTAHMMVLSRVRRPPDYPVVPQDDEPDTGELQPHISQQQSTIAQISPEAQRPLNTHSTREPPPTVSQECIPSPPSDICAHLVATSDSDGRFEEERIGGHEGVTPHSPNRSPDFSQQFFPKSGQNFQSPSLASLSTDIGQMSPRSKLLYQDKNIGGIYPNYEHDPERLCSPSSRHDSDDFFPDTSLQIYGNQISRQPSSVRQYQTSPGMGMDMEVPYQHAPVTIASAHTHHLPLLTEEQPEVRYIDAEANLLAGSMISLSSSASNGSSLGTERNRNSHKIEV